MRTVSDVACPACACICDDLRLTIDGEKLVRVEPDCPLAERWFFENAQHRPPAVEISGREASVDAAIAKAARILAEANYPLVYGLSRSSTAGQRAAVRLAEQIGAVVDTTASICHGPSIIAVQSVGESTCSLGEVRARSDLVIYWGCNPAETHPRHAERYTAFADGMFVPGGRAGRTIVMVGDAREVHRWRLDPRGSQPDVVVPLTPGGDFEAIATLRALVKGVPMQSHGGSFGAGLADLKSLAERMKSCHSGVVFFGLGLTGMSFDGSEPSSRIGHTNVESLLRLVAELNDVTRFYARRMRLQGDVSGADSVLCWQTGFPFSVDMARGYPRYSPGEYSANDLLQRGEPDACLLVGAECVPGFSPQAREHLNAIPTIILDYPAAGRDFKPDVRFTTAPYGLSASGTVYRMDEVPLPLHGPLPGPYPTDNEILRRINEHAILLKNRAHAEAQSSQRKVDKEREH
jgi:formylmethanofuran dehydrogenase subunit B